MRDVVGEGGRKGEEECGRSEAGREWRMIENRE